MKAYIVQPYYSLDGDKDIDKCYNGMLALMDSIPVGADIIVLPESCHCQARMSSNKLSYETKERLNGDFDKKVRQLAMRTGALVFANYGYKGDDGLYRNVTFGVNNKGETVAEYFKAHPAPSEVDDEFMNSDYSYLPEEPYVVEIDGVRYGFMTCYDFYMYENFAPLARKGVDVIIGCSHQRSDTHQALEIIGKFLCYNTNAYLLRASISLGEDSPICGCSMAVSPNGTMLGNMYSKVGVLEVEFNPSEKYYKKKGFYGTTLLSHYEYIDDGRRPWLYRNGGSMMVAQDKFMKYPRVCANGGYTAVAPKNSMPAFGSAIALSADEIAVNTYMLKDGSLVCPLFEVKSDDTVSQLEEISDGEFKGLKPVLLETVLQKFACHTIINVKIDGCFGDKKECAEKLKKLLYRYDTEQHAYITTGDSELLEELKDLAVTSCYLGLNVDKALEYGCKKIEFSAEVTADTVKKAKEKGLIVNVACVDDTIKAKELINDGANTVITNNFLSVSKAVKGNKND